MLMPRAHETETRNPRFGVSAGTFDLLCQVAIEPPGA